ncbi:MAG TPA: putative DNA binding domain-containing protein [Chloroflexota bacterium]|nr:putative DNA binding domain-containing protein [Chloroflexota bacterium]
MATKTGRRRSRTTPKNGAPSRQWRRMDLHLHTPGSNDYQQPEINYLDILRQAEVRGLDIIAFTDHNTMAGFAAMKKEIEQLLWLEERRRIEPDEKRRLDEYRRLLTKILVLPGFEFTATFGFHILGIFPSETPVSFLEHLLLTLKVPPVVLHQGSANVGATSDVLTAYRVIHEAGGIVIAAHANSGNGVAMRGLDFGGQTRIAYTQDLYLHTLEVTDLDKRGYTTRRFFDGSKPEYPRPMRCIQGSDAHRLLRDPAQPKHLGVGDRVTEILLPELTFAALADVLKGNDLSLTRPYRGPANPIDFVQLAQEEGESIVQAFHPSLVQRGGHQDRILQDICAMANTNGGAIYVGISADPKMKPEGVKEAGKAVEKLLTAVSNRITPEPHIHIDTLPSRGAQIVRITVQAGSDAPYAIDDNKFYVRDEAETSLAVRDEIVRLVERNLRQESPEPIGVLPPLPVPEAPATLPTATAVKPDSKPTTQIEPPRTGVEVVESEKRQGAYYHTVRDLRNGSLIKNVTRSSARKLWHYAISQVEAGQPKPKEIRWQGNIALINKREKDDNVWYDLALREADTIHVYYGVTDSGLNDAWLPLIEGA